MNKLTHKKGFVGECASGAKKYIDVYTVSSDIQGEQYYIQANLHGPEIAGIPVVFALIAYLKRNLLKGAVTLVPSANPWGLDTKVGDKLIGHSDFSQEKPHDWNRIFPKIEPNDCDFLAHIKEDTNNLVLTKEKLLAYTLLNLAIKADVIIDIHSVVNSIKHVYYYPHEIINVINFDVPVYIELGYSFSGTFDEAVLYPYLSNNAYLTKEVYVLELSEEVAYEANKVVADTATILNYLYRKGVIEESQCKLVMKSETFTIQEKKALYAPSSGIFLPTVKIGDSVIKGQLMGTMLRQTSSIKVNSPYNGIVKNITVNRTLELGQFMLGVLTKD